MGAPFIGPGDLKAAGFRGPQVDALNDAALDQAVLEATDFIENWIAPRTVLASAMVHAYDGARAFGPSLDLIQLDARPVNSVTSITENGLALTFGSDWDSAGTRDVQIDLERGILRRLRQAAGARVAPPISGRMWSHGFANIAVSFNAGYALAAVPAQVRGVCVRLAIAFYTAGRRVGQDDTSRSGRSDRFSTALTDLDRQILDDLSPHSFSVRCR